ncbi:MAG: glucosaminidase domain-containing protein [Chitinophagales bacterium]
MQALFSNTFVLYCLLGTQLLFAHDLLWIDTLSNEAAQQYVLEYKDVAVSDMHRTGIPASIKLAQAMFESNFGRSDLAIQGNNHFGIKCYRSWKGGRLYYNDDKPNECFRQYDWVDDSYQDHSRIITSKKRYASLFELAPIDYKGWAKGLQKTGYATDPQYAKKLIWMIEKHDLHQYDFEEDPFTDMDDPPIIALSSQEALENSPITPRQPHLPLAYTKKFGDLHEAAPDKLRVYQVNNVKLLKYDSIEPKIDLLTPTIADDIQVKNSQFTASMNEENAQKSDALMVTPSSRPSIKITTVPQRQLASIEVNATKEEVVWSNPHFKKRALPVIKPVIEKMTLSIPASIASKSVLTVENSFTIVGPSTEVKTCAIPFLKFTLEEEQDEEIVTVAPSSKTIVATTIATPSANPDADLTLLLSQKEILYTNKLKMVQYDQSVSLKAIATTYQISLDQLMKYNDITNESQILKGQTPIYLEAKRSKPATNNSKEHIVETGETMWIIAQEYGLQLEELQSRNYLKSGEEPRSGETILLKSQAPYPPKIKRDKPKANVSEEFKNATLRKIKEQKLK